jgi:hypothetical protein
MSATVTPLRREGPPLTKDQRALARGVPGLAERVAYDVAFKMLGGDPRSPDRIQCAHLGIYQAAQSWEPDLGEFSMWAYWKAVFQILTVERKERKQRRLLTAGRIAGLRLAAGRQHRVDLPKDASDDELMEVLVGLAGEQVVGNLLGVAAASEDPAEGDDDVAERDEWRHATDGLLRVLDSLQPEWRELFLLFAHGHDVKALAKERGVDYSNLLDRFHRQLDLVRARLEAQNVRGVPKRPADAPPALPERAPPEPRPPASKGTKGTKG